MFLLQSKHTTNLKNHLRAKHTGEYQIVSEINTAEPSRQNAIEVDTSPIIEKIKKLCVRLVTDHGRPRAMMEDEAFQELLNLASKKPNRHTRLNVKAIKNEITKVAHNKKINSNEIKNSLIGLKLDSATCLERKFVGINVQYIKKSEIVGRNLTVLEVNER